MALHREAIPVRRGEAQWLSKLTTKDVREIRNRYILGDGNQYTIAAAFGVCQGTVWHIIQRKTWKHVR